jgi:cytochrome oxidase Cu insertion factor (SCO1/SenC/PrrC family)
MGTVLDLLEEDAAQVAPLFVTVDPARDTVEIMAEFVAVFHPLLIELTGTQEQVAAAEEFRVYYESVEGQDAPDGYLMSHSGYMYLMRPDRRFETVFREGDQPPEQLVEEIQMRIENLGKSR